MKIIPVLDLMDGIVVRAVAGQRQQYRPIVSRLTESADPSIVLRTLRNSFGLDLFYIADLDGIRHRQSNWCVLTELTEGRDSFLIDTGIHDPSDAVQLSRRTSANVVLGLETLVSRESLRTFVELIGAENLTFSLDLRSGQPVCRDDQWQTETIEEIFQAVTHAGITRFIILDIADVGTDAGLSTLNLCERLRTLDRNVTLYAGGGVRNSDDLLAAQDAGVDGVLVASALHDGRLTRRDIERFCL
ncbi:MAG: HisA/HisF-related TIM barrel protein [Planctomycetaceae bacterium]